MRSVPIACLAIMLTIAIVGGCSSDPEEPQANENLPRRPKDISVQEIDPCSMFSTDQRAELQLEEATATHPTVNGRPSVGCVWPTGSDLGYAVQTIPISAETAKTDPSATVIQVNGYGAVRNVVHELTGGAPTCQVTIDVAPEQSIRVLVQGATQPRRSDEEMCRLATDAASKVMTTVVAISRR